MKKILLSLSLVALVFALGIGQGNKAAAPALGIDPDFGSLPLTFIPNRGQVAAPALFYARTPSYTVWLTQAAMVFDSREKTETPSARPASREVTRLEFLGANPKPVLTAQEPSPGVVNFFLGNDPTGWKTGVETSRAVLYQALYKNIDLKVYGSNRTVEYDWIVNPGGNIREVRFQIKGAARPAIDKDGHLSFKARHGEWIHRRPVAYQVIDGKRTEVRAEFRAVADDTFGLAVSSYDKSRPLMIDPVIVPQFSTFLGGSKDDTGCDLEASANGNVYVAGYTESSDFPVNVGYSLDLAGSLDIFVTKFAVSGKDLIYSTYIGGKGKDIALGIALNGGRAYLTGYTTSSDFPVKNAYDGKIGGTWDAFVIRLGAGGTDLEYSTFLGGKTMDEGTDIAVDAQGSAYVTGDTNSSDFPLLTPLDSTRAGQEAFVAKLAPNGRSLAYSTFLGGGGDDWGYGIALNGQGAAFVTGYTTSSNFPVKNAYDKSYNGKGDAFVARISQTGKSLTYSTYLGGASQDVGSGIALSGAGAAFVTGQTASSNFPIKSAYDKTLGGKDAFVTKLAADGKSLGYSTFLGGAKEDGGAGIAVSTDGTASLTGYTMSSDFPCHAGTDITFNGGQDAFLTKLASTGAKIVYSTYLGGNKNESGLALALDGNKNTYLTGYTASSNFPLKAAYDASQNGLNDAFIAKFTDADMTITNVRIRYLGMPDEVDVYGSNFGEHQGVKKLLCDGVPVPLDKTLWWSNGTLSFWTSGWLYPAIYWDHFYTFAIEENGAIISNTHSQRFLIHIDQVTPNSGATNAVIDVYGWTFGTTQGSNVLMMGSNTCTILSWGNTHIQARVPAAAAGSYYLYIQRGADTISDQYAFTHL